MFNLNALMGIGSRGVNTTPISVSGLPAANRLREEATHYEEQGNLEKAKECFEAGIREAEDLLQSTQNESELRKTRERLAASHFYHSTLLRKYDKLGAEENYKKALEHARHMDMKQPGARMLHQQISARYGSFLVKDENVSPININQTDLTKSALVDYLFEKALSTLGALKVSNKPSLFLVYAHDNPAYGQAEAYTSKYLIEKLSQVRVNLYSDQTPMGQTYLSSAEELKEDGKLEDILTNQLCLLPTRLRNDVKPVNKVVVCCSEVLGRYLEWSHYEDFYQELRDAYLKDCEQQGSSAIREVVKKFSQEQKYKAGFHHVLTEIAFLQIRAEHWQDQHGIIPVSLTPNSYEHCLAHFIPATTVRMEDMPRLDAQTKAGEVYPNQSRHGVLFKVIERLLVSSNEAKTFLDKFWQGYSECISRLKNQSSTLGGLEFVKLVDRIFGEIEKALHSELALTVQQQHQQLKHQQETELRSRKEPLAILGENFEEEYFTAWEESGEIQDGLAMYVAPHATTITDRKTTFNLDEAVTAFLTQKEDSGPKTLVLLLRGEAGSGKSTFNRHLARRLWREYSATSASKGRPIPLYISLPTVDRPDKNLIGQYLSDKCSFSPEQIEALRQSQRFILILDGYDEIPAEQRNLYADEKLDKWQAKIILSCRPEYLTEGYKNHLQPRGCSRLLLEYQLAPFSEQLIETYIDQYVEHTHAEWSAQNYKDTLGRIPNVKELLGTPFLLKMVMSVLPALDKVQPGQVSLTRIKLYEQFVQTWFERSLARLKAIQPKLTDAEQKAFRNLEGEFIGHSQAFNTDFALAMSEAKTTVAEYSPIARRGMAQDKRNEEFLGNKDEEKNLLRFSALLIRQNQQYRFVHKSIQDYLVARAVWEELDNPGGLDASADSTALNGIKEMRLSWEGLGPLIQADLAALLNKFNLVEDLAVQRFLVERVQQNKALVKPLLGWIKASTSQDTVNTAAANAMTILVGAGAQFNGADLRGIQIPGADLSFGVFDSAQLQGADLRNANLRNIWLREANLSGAQMSGVHFGESPYLQEESSVFSCAYSPDGKAFTVGLWNGTISVYDTSNWEKVHTLSGHSSWVNSVVYSPSSQQIASGSEDHTVRLWDAHTGEAHHTLRSHTESVESVVYSPSGQKIASGSDHTVRVWDAQSGHLSHTLEGHTSYVTSVVYSPNGAQIASGSHDYTVRLWDAQSGYLSHTLSGHSGWVESVVYSPNGHQVASGSNYTVRVWDAQSGQLSRTLHGHTNLLRVVVYSPSGAQIASGSTGKTVRLWDANSDAPGLTLTGHTDSVSSLVYSPSGQQIASSSKDNTVRVWDAQSSQPLRILHGHTDFVRSIVYSPSGQQIASGGSDNTVRLWNTQSSQLSRDLSEHTGSVTSVAYSPNGQQIASSSDDHTVRVWDAKSGQLSHILCGHTSSVTSVMYSPSSQQIASGSNKDHTVRVWDAQNGQLSYILQGYADSYTYSPSGQQIAFGSMDDTVQVWNAQSSRLSLTLRGHITWVTDVVYSPSGQQIVSSSEDDTARVWDAQSGQLIHILTRGGYNISPIFSVAYSPSGGQIASRGIDCMVHLWDAQSGHLSRILEHTGGVNSMVYSPNGAQIASGSEDKAVRLWDAQSGHLSHTLGGHTDGVTNVVYSPGGQQIASSSKDNTVRVWDVTSGQCQATIQGFRGAVRGIAWKAAPNGDYLVTGCADYSVRVWQVHEVGDKYSASLLWSSMHDVLTLADASIQDVQGLSWINEKLLRQRGAVSEPLEDIEDTDRGSSASDEDLFSEEGEELSFMEA